MSERVGKAVFEVLTVVRLGALAMLVVIFLSVFAGIGFAEDCGCEEGTDPFPEATVFLEEAGYPSDVYRLLLTWRERAKRGCADLITGYHVNLIGTDQSFDLYATCEGRLLGDDEISLHGIRRKSWNLPPIEQGAKYPQGLAKHLAVRPSPRGRPGLGDTIRLPALDVEALAAEDATRESAQGKGAFRIGVVRNLAAPIVVSGTETSDGRWESQGDGGLLWSVIVESPEAVAQRIHFEEFAAPDTAELLVFNADNPSEAYGPYGRGTDFWSASCFAGRVAIECYVPAGPDAAHVRIVIDKAVHTYRGLDHLAWHKVVPGSCNNDVSCYPAWASASAGVGAYGYITNVDQLSCTGSLIGNSVPGSVTPYFLTAYHCVHTQTKAETMEFFWLYQTERCDGDVPSLSEVPNTSGGADFLVGSPDNGGSDLCLVRLREAPPANLPRLGWSTVDPPIGTEVTGIHHPRGSHKRISFATTVDDPTLENSSNLGAYHQVLWHSGTTESGSSGSPLLLTDSQVIIGQLWGGRASCGNSDVPDYYGPFSVSFPLMREWLAPEKLGSDVDWSGEVDGEDVQHVVDAALGKPVHFDVDIDLSGKIDAVDIQLVINSALD